MTDLIGQTIGNYQIEALLGSGGMGQVFSGRHIHLARQAAIKVMHPHLAADPGFRARFLREVKSAESLKHPNVVEIFDFGQQHERYYLVMELLPAGSLRSLLHSRADRTFGWPIALGIDLVRQAAEALAFAHERGVVHRDIKPDNLLLAKGNAPAAYTLKVSDFGLARLAEGNEQPGTETQRGTVLGTPAYMSPEQCQGGPLDGRSDIYALGVVLYEIATGQLPFAVKNINQAIHRHVYTAPTPPRQLCADLPVALEAIILRCLAKQPDERYATAAALADALRELLTDPALATIYPDVPPLEPAGATPGLTSAVPLRPTTGIVPRVQVLDQQGQPRQVVELTASGLTIGRLASNAIVLDDPAVGRHHLRVGWDGTQATVADLGARAGTRLAEQTLTPYQAQAWEWGQLVQAGPFSLRLDQRAARGEQPKPRPAGGSTERALTSRVISERIGVALTSGQNLLALVPDQTALVSVILTNRGATPDKFVLAVEGLPHDWAQVPAREIPLGPGMQTSAVLRITVPQHSSSRAGDYPVTIRARSQQNPLEYGQTQAVWTVTPFAASSLAISPKRAQGQELAAYTLTIGNAGNAPLRYTLAATDAEQRLAYQFGQDQIVVEPGDSAELPVTVALPRRLLGSERRHPFDVQASADAGDAPQATAVFVQRPVVPL